jgi:hypothetical protein
MRSHGPGIRTAMRHGLFTLAAAGLLAFPAAAQETVTYEGETSQGRSVKVLATPEGDMTQIRMGWRADCGKPGNSFRTRTKWLDPIEQSGNSFSDSGEYTQRDGPYRYRIKGSLEGTFDATNGADATARYSVRVRRRGKLVDRCRSGRIEWTATRAG